MAKIIFKIGDLVKIKPNFMGINTLGISKLYIEEQIGKTFIIKRDQYRNGTAYRLKDCYYIWNSELLVGVNRSNKCKKYK